MTWYTMCFPYYRKRRGVYPDAAPLMQIRTSALHHVSSHLASFIRPAVALTVCRSVTWTSLLSFVYAARVRLFPLSAGICYNSLRPARYPTNTIPHGTPAHGGVTRIHRHRIE